MKYLAAAVFLAVLSTVPGASAMGSNPPAANPGQAQGTTQPAGSGDADTLIHRPTTTPAPAAASPKDKKPLTATLSKDDTGKSSQTVFASSDPKIYLVWKDETGAKGDKVRIAWFAEDTGGAISKNKKLREATQVLPNAGAVGSSYLVMPSGGFPAGKYRVDVYDGAKLAKSLKFTVKK